MDVTCNCCNNEIHPERAKLGYEVCIACASQGVAQPPKAMGVMVYGHKTAGEMQLVTEDQFKDHRKYNPYGRNTGRGSGVHRVMQSSNK